MSTQSIEVGASPSKLMRGGLWLAQVLVSALFLSGAFMKFGIPIEQLSKIMPWTGEVSPMLVYGTGLVDALGGIGILFPALTRIRPELTAPAAIGCFLLQICAFVFHVTRGDPAPAYLTNVVVMALAAFVGWGYARRRAPRT